MLAAYETSNSDDPPGEYSDDSWTWTFYHFRTQTATVTLRWFGTSNGYYSEDVSFYETHSPVLSSDHIVKHYSKQKKDQVDGVIEELEGPLFDNG